MLGGFGARLSAGAATTLVRVREELRADSLGLGCDRGEDEVVGVGRVAWVVGLLSGMVMMIGVAEGLEAAQMCTQCKIRKCKLSETLNRGSCVS